MSYRLRLYPYCGGTTDVIHDDELDACRLAAAGQIRRHRDDARQPVTILDRGVRWELQTGEDAGMIGDGEGILGIEEILTRCRLCGDMFADEDAVSACGECRDDDPGEGDDVHDHQDKEEE